MKVIISWLLLFGSPAFAAEPLMPNEAQKYLEQMDCAFSAFSVYTGKDVSSMIGSLKNGQAYSRVSNPSSSDRHDAGKSHESGPV